MSHSRRISLVSDAWPACPLDQEMKGQQALPPLEWKLKSTWKIPALKSGLKSPLQRRHLINSEKTYYFREFQASKTNKKWNEIELSERLDKPSAIQSHSNGHTLGFRFQAKFWNHLFLREKERVRNIEETNSFI